MLLTGAQTGSHIGGSWDHDNPFHSRSPGNGDHWSYCQCHLSILPFAIFFLTNPGYGELFLRYSTTMHCLVTPGTIRYGFGNANDQRRIRRFFPIEKCFTPIDQRDIV